MSVVKSLSLCGVILSLLGCPVSIPPKFHPSPHKLLSGMKCEWGSSRFNLCGYQTKSEVIEALIAEMTLDEKLGQMVQATWHNNNTPEFLSIRGIGSVIHSDGPTPGLEVSDWTSRADLYQAEALKTRLGIPLMLGIDAIHGQNFFEGAVIFPHNIGMGATRNYKLIQRAAEITALETAATGFHLTFSPCLAMPEHEHWGRVYEAFSEDQEISTKASLASIRGLQGLDLAAPETIAATAKHFLGDGATADGLSFGNSILSKKVLRERHLPPYKMAVNAGVAVVMAGFHEVNGTNMHHHADLIQGVLKNELGFKGVVMTDWDGGTRFGPTHLALNAGLDLFMQPINVDDLLKRAKSSVLDGTVTQSRIDDAVRRILNLKFRLGLFKHPFANPTLSKLVGSAEHRQVARQAVRESLVLLKTTAGLLPLQVQEPIAVVGPHAAHTGLQSGGWTIRWQGSDRNYYGSTNILDGMIATGGRVNFYADCHAQMEAQKVVVVVGEPTYAEEYGDSNELDLPQKQKDLIDGCKALGKQVIVVLISGRPLAIPETIKKSDAFIAAWLPGSEGAGVADFLYGANGFKPTGKLPLSWPADYKDLPLAPDSTKAMFPLGFGLQDY